MPGITCASAVLVEAARVGLTLLPEDLPDSAQWLYEAIVESLVPSRACGADLGAAPRRLAALDAAVSLCEHHTGSRLTPSALLTPEPAVQPTLAACFAVHGIPEACTLHTLTCLAHWCQGGLKVPTLRGAENWLRNVRMRRDYQGGDDYAAICRRYKLSVSRVREILALGGIK